nr:phosphoenolpyruvate-utilizing N-terminal domain-containing protein [Mycoplasmopsis bovis]
MHIKGIGASKGIAIAKAFKINELPLEILNNSKGVEFETNLFDKAVKQIAEDIQHTIEVATTKEQKEIFGAHLLLAQDPVALLKILRMLLKMTISLQYMQLMNILVIWSAVFDSMDDSYMKERAADIRDILRKFLYFFHGIRRA